MTDVSHFMKAFNKRKLRGCTTQLTCLLSRPYGLRRAPRGLGGTGARCGRSTVRTDRPPRSTLRQRPWRRRLAKYCRRVANATRGASSQRIYAKGATKGHSDNGRCGVRAGRVVSSGLVRQRCQRQELSLRRRGVSDSVTSDGANQGNSKP